MNRLFINYFIPPNPANINNGGPEISESHSEEEAFQVLDYRGGESE